MKNNQNYEAPKMDVVLFNGEIWDVVTTSNGTGNGTKIDTGNSVSDPVTLSENEYNAYR